MSVCLLPECFKCWFMSWLPDVLLFSLKAITRTAISFSNLNSQCGDSREAAL